MLASHIKIWLDGLLLVLAASISEITLGSPFDSLVEGLLSNKSVLAAMTRNEIPFLGIIGAISHGNIGAIRGH